MSESPSNAPSTPKAAATARRRNGAALAAVPRRLPRGGRLRAGACLDHRRVGAQHTARHRPVGRHRRSTRRGPRDTGRCRTASPTRWSRVPTSSGAVENLLPSRARRCRGRSSRARGRPSMPRRFRSWSPTASTRCGGTSTGARTDGSSRSCRARAPRPCRPGTARSPSTRAGHRQRAGGAGRQGHHAVRRHRPGGWTGRSCSSRRMTCAVRRASSTCSTSSRCVLPSPRWSRSGSRSRSRATAAAPSCGAPSASPSPRARAGRIQPRAPVYLDALPER